jgi:hypothetical protein
MLESNPGSPLSSQQLVLLSIEVQSATNLLRDGCTALRAMTHTSEGIDTVWTLLALGVEKLCKVTVGLDGVNKHGIWPTKRVLKYRHDIVRLESRVRRTMRETAGSAVRPHVVLGALEHLDADPIWPLLCAGLDRYGNNGRYHYLDWVGAKPDFDSPRGYWDTVETAAISMDPELMALFRSTAPGDFDSARRRTNLLIEASIRGWWEAVHLSWLHGCLGPDARAMSSAIST